MTINKVKASIKTPTWVTYNPLNKTYTNHSDPNEQNDWDNYMADIQKVKQQAGNKTVTTKVVTNVGAEGIYTYHGNMVNWITSTLQGVGSHVDVPKTPNKLAQEVAAMAALKEKQLKLKQEQEAIEAARPKKVFRSINSDRKIVRTGTRMFFFYAEIGYDFNSIEGQAYIKQAGYEAMNPQGETAHGAFLPPGDPILEGKKFYHKIEVVYDKLPKW